jgi:hypothetical protein
MNPIQGEPAVVPWRLPTFDELAWIHLRQPAQTPG